MIEEKDKIIMDENLLKQVSVEVENSEEANIIISRLRNVFDTKKALGLAAPQIGIQKRVFIASIKNKNDILEAKAFVNPRIIKKSHEKMLFEEGCLSFPGIYVRTNRPRQITVQDDLNGRLVLTGISAIVFQHEYDHLNGIFFTTRGYLCAVK